MDVAMQYTRLENIDDILPEFNVMWMPLKVCHTVKHHFLFENICISKHSLTCLWNPNYYIKLLSQILQVTPTINIIIYTS